MRKVAAIALFLGLVMTAGVAQASPISIYTAPNHTYENTENDPCIFYGPGGSGCNQNPEGFEFVGDTGGGTPFTPYPLTNIFGDEPGELALFGQYVGREFLIGLDINDTGTPQVLDNLTVNFFNAGGTNIGSYTFAPATAVGSNANGVGYADFVLSAGCDGVTVGSGVTATCTNYHPFIAPVGTRQIAFTFGLTGYNDGADKLFLISAGPTPVPFSDDPPPTPVPEPASLALLGSGLLGVVRSMRKRKTVV